MDAPDLTRPVFIPVILGTSRQGRLSEPAANFVVDRISKRPDLTTELIDIRKLNIRIDDAGEALKDSQFSATCARADGFILVVPEYNHSFPGLLKHVLDTNLKEYIHKAVGVCGVSAGPFGGARMIQSLLPVLRELGLVEIFWDVNFGLAGKLFDPATGAITDTGVRRSPRQVRERARLDVARPALRARKSSRVVAAAGGRCSRGRRPRLVMGMATSWASRGQRPRLQRQLFLDQQNVVPVGIAHHHALG